MQNPDLGRIRQFNRTFVRRIGALDGSYLKLGRPLGEARLLYEIGTAGADLRGLRRGLGLDSGYLSRLLRGLERQGLAEVRPAPSDARARQAALTPAGREALAAYDAASDAFAEAVLAPLTPAEREKLLAAMDVVERLASRHAIEVEAVSPDDPELQTCYGRYFDELAQRFDDGFSRDRYLSLSPDDGLRPPHGRAFLARLDGAPIGCGALKVHADDWGEAKRIWAAPEARGRGVATRIMQEIEAVARKLGLKELRLGTHRSLAEARAMYPALGYEEVVPFDQDPFTHHWYRKRIG